MKLHDLQPNSGAAQTRKRVGRGTGSGRGKTSGRGVKGQNARTGGGVRPGFEGGQYPLVQRLPKLRGFNNRFKIHYVAINLDRLSERFEAGAEVTATSLVAAGLLSSAADPVVLLGRGDVGKPLHVKVQRVSAGAKQKIEEAGGSVELSPVTVNRRLPRS